MKRYIKSATEEKLFTRADRIRLFGEDPEGEIVIPDGYTIIDDYAFRYCEGLTKITIPNSAASIGEWAFEGCSRLTRVVIPVSITSIGSHAFCRCTSLADITIPNSVTSIGWGAFYNCRGLTRITIPDSVTSIGDYTFCYCSSLTRIKIPNSVTSIGFAAFSGCTSLTSITIPGSVTRISNSAFYNCSSLTSINIPNSVTSIGDYTFYKCSSLKDVNFEGDPDLIEFGADVFDDTPLENKFDEEATEYSLETWEDLKSALDSDFKMYDDPIYRQTPAGIYIDGLCQDVESDYGVWLEPSIQAGRGGIWVYTTEDDTCIARNIDYEDFNQSVLEMVMDSNSEEEFKSSYGMYLDRVIDLHPCEDEDEEY